MEWQKQNRDEPSRALLPRELAAFTGEDARLPLHPFVELVRRHGELAFCFRGNDRRNPRVCLYEKNHVVFTVLTSGKTLVSFDHARYCENWREYYGRLTEEFGFSGSVKRDARGFLHIGEMGRSLRDHAPLTLEQLEDLYASVLRPMFEVYFQAEERGMAVDYFKNGTWVKVPGKLEKRRQQELFSTFTATKSGYFFYDMEFSERHSDLESQRSDGANNKPDMLGLRFDACGKPERLAFVEVKSTKAALSGDSGLLEHLRRMQAYGSLAARRREACQIMSQYARLSLRGLTESDSFAPADFADLRSEILLVFTDEALREWQTSPAFSALREQTESLDIGPSWAGLFTLEYINHRDNAHRDNA